MCFFSAGSREEEPRVRLKEEKMDSVEAEPRVPSSVMISSVTDSPAAAPSPCPPAERASPPSSSLPFTPVVIKQEPQSPVHVSSELDPADDITHCAHSTTPELPVASAAASPPGNIIQRTAGVFHFLFGVHVSVLIQVHLKLLQMLPFISSRLLKDSLKQNITGRTSASLQTAKRVCQGWLRQRKRPYRQQGTVSPLTPKLP